MRRTFETALHKVSEQLGQRMAGSPWAGAVADCSLRYSVLSVPPWPSMRIVLRISPAYVASASHVDP
jgi:hypothetical protein